MNYYFLLEDSKSFIKILPKWLTYLGFTNSRVPDIASIRTNEYILQSGHGVTRLVNNVVYETLETIIQNPDKIDRLVIILDSEGRSVEEQRKYVFDQIRLKYKQLPVRLDIFVIVCKVCFETWLLGAKDLYPDNPVPKEHSFYAFYSYYNIDKDDPEEMQVPDWYSGSIGKFHFQYLHDLLLYKKERYSKKKPDLAGEREYFARICLRVKDTGHLHSFEEFLSFIKNEVVKQSEKEV